ncbi:hypothetical protein BGX29_005309 [Mortierella sp. GBA35]|nr:hypothetical protein BGX29_005309 [Mortierella sp. GBA35]
MELDPLDIGSSSINLPAKPIEAREVDESDEEAELAQLFVEMEGDEEMLDADIPVDPSTILASFECALSDAIQVRDTLYAEKSKCLKTRKERVTFPDSSAKTRALRIIDDILDKTTKKLAVQTTRVEEAQKELDVYKKTLPSPKPTPTLQDEVVIDINQPYHAALGRLFNFKTVPVHPGTREVDFSRLQLKDLGGPDVRVPPLWTGHLMN